MAEANIELERMAELLRIANEELIRNGKISEETQNAITDAQMKAKFGVENFTKATKTAGEALGSLVGVGVQSAKAMYEGKKGMSAFNSSLDELSKAAALAGTALTLLMPGGIIMKAVIGGLTMAATAAIAYTKAANDMADKLYKGYEGLQKSGAAASDGMTGVYRDAKKLGLGMNELDSFVTLVAENSKDLALFSGTVYEGRKKFADMGKALEGSRAEFFKMGISQEAQNEGMANYLKTVTRTGRAQQMTTDQLAASARGYIYEQDALAKITGMSAKQQQAALEKALQNEQFLAKIRQLEASGDYKKADELKKLNAYYAAMGDEAAEGFQATVNGNLRNKAAQKLNFTSQGEVLRSTQDVIAGTKTAAQAFDATAGRVAETEKTIGRTQAQFGMASENGLKYTEQVNFAIAAQGKKREELEKQVNEEVEKQKKGVDKITGNQGEMLRKEQKIRDKYEEGVFQGIANAQANMDKLANITDTLADAFLGLTKVLNKVLKWLGLGEKEAPAPKQMTAAEKTAAAKTEAERSTAKPLQERVDTLGKQLDADEKALKDAKRSGKFGDEIAPLEKKIAENKRKYEQATKELLEAEEKIKKAAVEESKLRLKQMQDRKKLAQLERENLEDAEEIANLNEKKADMVKQGKDTSAIDKKIAERKASVAARSAEVSQLQTSLKTSAAAPAASGDNQAAGGAAPKSAAGPEPHGGTAGGTGGKVDLAQVSSKSGKTASVNKEYAPRFQQLIDYLDGVGYKIYSLGGYVDRDVRGQPGVKSVHAHGGAIDINPGENPMGPQLITDMPPEISKVASDLGLGWGGNWKSTKDAMHFSVAKHEGGDIKLSEGGVAVGPNSGYPATLHGEEAVIPLNNGGGNFVKMFEDMAMMMGKQASAMDELIRVAKNSNDIQTKILRMQS